VVCDAGGFVLLGLAAEECEDGREGEVRGEGGGGSEPALGARVSGGARAADDQGAGGGDEGGLGRQGDCADGRPDCAAVGTVRNWAEFPGMVCLVFN